ncbi:hypothetical protein Leryth_015745 [Lithospermum erythrorhizon]|nr:hypothetical protein Leryth_015745 [Lithospermum erythrorhizon]
MFLDKRIGEQNEDLEEFEKSILRSQRERQLKFKKKKNKFNLSDGEDDEFEFGGGLSSPGRDDFEDDFPFDEDEDGIAAERGVTSSHLNTHEREGALASDLLDGPDNKPKSKKEAMAELILKSKFFKAQHAKEKEENQQLVDQLDKDFTSLVQSKAMFPLTQPNKMNALKALTNTNISIDTIKKDDVSVDQTKSASHQENHDSYDMLVSEMALDIRAKPSDRTKTPEEIAQEEKERLEQLEEERQKRMVADDDGSDEDTDDPKDDNLSTKHSRSISGDDLGDSFTVDEEKRNKLRWIDLMLQKKSEESVGEDSSASDDSDGTDDDDVEEEGSEEEEADDSDDISDEAQCLKDWEQSDDDKFNAESDDEEEQDGDGNAKLDVTKDHKQGLPTKGGQLEFLAKKAKAGGCRPQKPDELPYTIEAPKSLEEFTSLVENRSNDQIIEAIRRIRTFNAINVAAENRKKIHVFYGVLLQYFAILPNKKPLNFELLNMLVKPLIEMSSQVHYFAAICARQWLLQIRTQFCGDLKDAGKRCWPSLKTLFLLRLWSMIFPCSDFRHVVMTPAILLMCEYLMRCPIKSGRDVAIGSFLCSLVLSVSKQSLKFSPEAIVFLRTMLTAALNEKNRPSLDSQLLHLMEIKSVGPLLHIQSSVEEINSLDFCSLMDMLESEDSPYFSSVSFRASVLAANIETLNGFITIYDQMNSFPEIFSPISNLLHKLVDQKYMPDALKDRMGEVARLIDTKIEEHHKLRLPLQMRKKKILPIKLYEPKFVEEGYVKGRDYDPDRERAEQKKLKKLLKQEAKGARRELRKDNHFLFQVKQNQKDLENEERVEKYGKARAFLQEQEHAFKSGQLGKNRKRRR